MKGSIDSFDMSCFSLYGPAVLTYLSQSDKKMNAGNYEAISTIYMILFRIISSKWQMKQL